MKPERIERMLQDYLDGRLPAEQRAAFEAELRDDPRLSARVEQYRRIGDALREPAAELSPGFYTRAKARFAESHRKEPRWFRVLSWETAGLATAVVLVGAIFLPSLFRSELSPLSPPPGAVAVDLAGEARQVLSDELEAAGETAGLAAESAAEAVDKTFTDVPPAPAVAEPAGPPARVEVEPGKKRSAKVTPPSEIPVAGADVFAETGAADDRSKGLAAAEEGEERADRSDFAPVPRRQRIDADEDDRAKSETGERRAAPLPTRAAMELPAEQAPRRDPSVSSGLEQEAPSPTDDREFAVLSSRIYLGDDIEILVGPLPSLRGIDARPADAIPLPEGFVEPGAIRQMTDPQAIERLVRGSGEESVRSAAPSEPVRLVLIGPGSPAFDCATILVGRSRESHEILLRPADRPADRDYGCAVALPDDSLPVTIHVVKNE